jgi:hypothetical protein
LFDQESPVTVNPLNKLPRLTQGDVQLKSAWNRLCVELERQLGDIRDTIRRDAISASFTQPSAVLTAADAGTDASITVANHVRYWGDETSVSVTGDVFTGLAFTTVYAVYYDDETRAQTAPDYQITTDIKTAQNNYAPGRILVGTVETPANGDPPVSGGTAPPGSGYDPGGGGYNIP